MKYSVQLKCDMLHYNYIVKKIFQSDIEILNSYIKNNEYYFAVYEEDYIKLSKLDYKKVIVFVNYIGIYNLYNYIKNNLIYFVVTFLIVTLLFLSNYLIVRVNIHTNNMNINLKIKYFLIDNKIDNFKIKKDFKSLNKIKNNILKKYNNDIEWIEIAPHGYTYDIFIIERKKNVVKKDSDRCNYVANKSGTITKIKATKGMLLVQENNYVNQGDVLISGEVIYNDELKAEVCASGKILGEVWYEVDVSYPLKRTYSISSANKFYNLSFYILNKNYIIFKNKYRDYEKIRKYGNKTFGINIITSAKSNKKIQHIDEKYAIDLALKKANKYIQLKSHNKSKILSQNILKKSINNDTIYMKVLITSEEELGVVESY